MSLLAACGFVLATPLSEAQPRRTSTTVTAEAAPRRPRPPRVEAPSRRARAAQRDAPARRRPERPVVASRREGTTASRRRSTAQSARPRRGQRARHAVPIDEPEPEAFPGTSPSRSIGSANRGRLRRGVSLTSTPHLVVRGGRTSAFGTAELVGALQRAAARVAEQHPGPRLVVGDLSGEHGGRLSPHRSHRSGRDADISFYLVDERGEPVEAPRFVHLGRSGCGPLGGRQYCLDPVRSFSLVAALLDDPSARVQYVLVAADLRERLLAEGARRGAPAEVLDRVRIATDLHAGSRSHRSHFHVRIYCPIDDRPECIDDPPYHAWYEGMPAPRHRPAVRRPTPDRRRATVRRSRD
jgi:penicillin-insensitive murein endopeptidase